MPASAFVDTNVLLYAISTTPAEATKRAQARKVLGTDGWGVSVQVLQEFFVNATRAPNPAMENAAAEAAIKELMQRPLVSNTPQLLLDALRLRSRFGLSFWDASIVAAARQSGAPVLYSEDLNDGQDYDGVTVVNPFAAN